jgi:tRNA A-37 threonylcarbamoyl transferase component Bud32
MGGGGHRAIEREGKRKGKGNPQGEKIREQAALSFYVLGEVVGRLHSGGLIHGDITTSNILVMEEEEGEDGLHLVLIDFGLR